MRALLESGREAVVVDDLSTRLARRVPAEADLAQGSLLDTELLTDVLRRVRPTGVIHRAAKRSPTESMTDPSTRLGR